MICMASYIYDHIFAQAETVKYVADKDGTPFYLYHKQGILDNIQTLHSAFAWMPGYQNYFLLRENNNPHILKLLAEAGTGVSACSYTELRLAQACGFSGEQLIYEPCRRDSRGEELARELDATWMINGIDLLPLELPNRIILHYHPSEERLNTVQFSMVKKSKNGINRLQLFEVLKNLHTRGVDKLGLALQVASYSIKPGFLGKKAQLLLSLAKTIQENLGFSLWSIHIGEGPGLPYQPRAKAPTIAEEAEQVRLLFAALPDDDAPVLFTGVNRQLMGQNGIMVTKVLEQRNLYRTILVLDAGIGHYLRPVLNHAYRHISVLGRDQIENRKRYFMVGQLPDEIDHPVQRGRMLPKVTIGEYLVFHDVGCGGRSMAMLYGCSSVAGEYLYEEDGNIRRIAPHRTEQEVLEFLTAL